MDAQSNDQTSYSDVNAMAPEVSSDLPDNSSSEEVANPSNEIDLNPLVNNASKAVVSEDADSLNDLKKTVEDLRKGVNPILDENKALKEKLEALEAQTAEPEAVDSPSEDQAAIDSLNLATRDDVKADIEAMKADMVLEKRIDDLGIGEKKQELVDLMSLDSNKGLSPHEVAEKYRLADDSKINQAKFRALRGTPSDGTSKNLRNTEDVDWTNQKEVDEHVRLNSTNNDFC